MWSRLREHRGLRIQEELFSKLKVPGGHPGQALMVQMCGMKLREDQVLSKSQASSPHFK